MAINMNPNDKIVDYIRPEVGNYSPGAESSLAILTGIINASWKYGIDKTSTFETLIENITDPVHGWLSSLSAPKVTGGAVSSPHIIEPAVNIPASAEAGDVFAMYDSKYLELVELLVGKFVEFRAMYSPNAQGNYTAADAWLPAAPDTPETALPPGVVEQLLTEDRDRILIEASRASDAVLAEFAARRFPLPPGAAAAAVLQLQQQAQGEIAASSRKIVITSIERMQWCIQQALALRQLAMDAAVKYITALASGPEMASRLVNIGYDAQSKLISAAAAFYNARSNAAETVAKIEQFNVGTALDAAKANQASELKLIEDRLRALLAECQALAQQATSLFNNLHAQAGSSYGISSSYDTNHNYNHEDD
jgi:hypothetical protein